MMKNMTATTETAEKPIEERELEYRFARNDEPDIVNLADDPRLKLLAVSIASQQSAGFRNYLDLRQASCPDCGNPGFNTGWGYWQFCCGAEVMTDGEFAAECPSATGGSIMQGGSADAAVGGKSND